MLKRDPNLPYVPEAIEYQYATKLPDTQIVPDMEFQEHRKDVHEYDEFLDKYAEQKRDGAQGPALEKMKTTVVQKVFTAELRNS